MPCRFIGKIRHTAEQKVKGRGVHSTLVVEGTGKSQDKARDKDKGKKKIKSGCLGSSEAGEGPVNQKRGGDRTWA